MSRGTVPTPSSSLSVTVAVCACLAGISACGGGDGAGDSPTEPTEPGSSGPAPETVQVSPEDTSLNVSDTAAFSATVRDSSGDVMEDEPVTWSSTDPSILSVDDQGVAEAVGEGQAEVTAEAGPAEGTASVEVREVDGVIDSEGGTVTAEDGEVVLEVPEGSVSESTQIMVEPFSPGPTDVRLASGRSFEFGPEGVAFDPPATLTLSYDPGDLPRDADEDRMRIYRRQGPGRWRQVEGNQVDAGSDEVSAPIDGFSKYALGTARPVGQDAFVANGSNGAEFILPNQIWKNDGSGVFSQGPSVTGEEMSTSVAMGDLDGDGDADAFVTNQGKDNKGAPDVLWLNDGSGGFSRGSSLGEAEGEDVALGDLDGDGDLDAFVANEIAEIDTARTGTVIVDSVRVWTNDGSANFSRSPGLAPARHRSVALGDVDGDGDLDALAARGSEVDLWRNDGTASFTREIPKIFQNENNELALGDLDGDGDLDAFVLKFEGFRTVLNDGTGFFNQGATFSANLPEDRFFRGFALGDVDGDGDLDAFVAVGGAGAAPNQVWINDGSANFTRSGQSLGMSRSNEAALGDLDGDGDLDAFVANRGGNRIWLNDGTGTFTDSGQDLHFRLSNDVALF